jgi:hypothetical protein
MEQCQIGTNQKPKKKEQQQPKSKDQATASGKATLNANKAKKKHCGCPEQKGDLAFEQKVMSTAVPITEIFLWYLLRRQCTRNTFTDR